MARYIELIPLDRDDLSVDAPVPYDIYNEAGGLLIARGQVVTDLARIKQLLRDGLRVRPPGSHVAARQVAADTSTDAAAVPRPTAPLANPFDVVNQAIAAAEALLEPERHPPPARGIPRHRPPLARARALIAEDMPLSRKLLANMLARHRIEGVEIAEDGLAAVRKFQAARHDMVFLDIDMPVLDGLTALAQIRAMDPDVFVCLVSANSSRVNVQKAKSLGVNGFLVKPISGLNVERILALYTHGK